MIDLLLRISAGALGAGLFAVTFFFVSRLTRHATNAGSPAQSPAFYTALCSAGFVACRSCLLT
jgi:hypothetical protein